LLTAGCGDLVSSPDRVEVILPPAEELVALVRGLGDASTRVTGSLGSGTNALRVRDAVSAIERALNAADASAAGRALNDAKSAISGFLGSEEMRPDLGPDASVVEIVLLVVEESIQRPCAAIPTTTTNTVASSFASCK
jgi:hypothetical protein